MFRYIARLFSKTPLFMGYPIDMAVGSRFRFPATNIKYIDGWCVITSIKYNEKEKGFDIWFTWTSNDGKGQRHKSMSFDAFGKNKSPKEWHIDEICFKRDL